METPPSRKGKDRFDDFPAGGLHSLLTCFKVVAVENRQGLASVIWVVGYASTFAVGGSGSEASVVRAVIGESPVEGSGIKTFGGREIRCGQLKIVDAMVTAHGPILNYANRASEKKAALSALVIFLRRSPWAPHIPPSAFAEKDSPEP